MCLKAQATRLFHPSKGSGARLFRVFTGFSPPFSRRDPYSLRQLQVPSLGVSSSSMWWGNEEFTPHLLMSSDGLKLSALGEQAEKQFWRG